MSPANTSSACFSTRPTSTRHRVASQLPVGSKFGGGRYELQHAIAHGGSCVVHVVWDFLLERKLAGKFLTTDDELLPATMAKLEARATARLRHPNIVTLHEVGAWDGVPYLLMELLDGTTLTSEIVRAPLAPRRAVAVCLEVAAALEHAHERGVFHFDLKPGNVHVGDNGSVKVIDFGVGSSSSRPVDAEELSGARDSYCGTPGYMAPEQWAFAALDARTDVWALGALLYECLTKSLPYAQRQPRIPLAPDETWQRPRVCQLQIPKSMELLIEKALALDPAHRFQTMSEVRAMLQLVGTELLCKTIDALSNRERWLVGAAGALGGNFTAQEIHVLTGVPMAGLAQQLCSLVRDGVLAVQISTGDVRYRASDAALSGACLARLPRRGRSVVLDHAIATKFATTG